MSCSEQAPHAGIARWLDQEPSRLLEAEVLSRDVGVFEWGFESAEDLAPWSFRSVESYSLEDGGLQLQTSKRSARLIRTTRFEAEEVEIVEVEVARHTAGRSATLLFAPPRQTMSNDLRLQVRAIDRASSSVYRFPVGDHPDWRGTIGRLSIALDGPRVRVERVAGLALASAVESRVAEALNGSWRVEIENDRRNAVITGLGEPQRRSFEIPPAAELRVATAMLTVDDGAETTLRVSIETSAGTRHTLLEERLLAADGWTEHRLDLSPFAGQTGEVVLESISDRSSGTEADLDLVAWANPEILWPPAVPRRPSVVLVSLDTLRADRLSLNGHSRPTTPRIDAWASTKAVNFPNAIASAPWTLPSHASIFTGLDAVRHGVDHNMSAPLELTLMAEMLRAEGYSTHAVTGGGLLHPEHGLDQGFDTYRYWGTPPGKRGWAMDVDWGLEQVLGLLESYRDRPVFLFFHTYEVHAPHVPRSPFYEQFGGRHLETIDFVHPRGRPFAGPRDGVLKTWDLALRSLPDAPRRELPESELAEATDRLYDAGLAYADLKIGRLFERLEELGLGDDTLLILTSDHGESLGEHDQVTHCCLYDDTLKVPLLIALPRRFTGGRTVTDQVRSVDILPTVLDLVEASPQAGVDGRSLRPMLEGEAQTLPPAWSYAYQQGVSVRVDNRLKYLLYNHPWPPDHGVEELFDLQRDPAELENLAGVRELASLRAETFARLLDRPGLRVDLRSSSERSLTGTISSPALVRKQQIKCFPQCPNTSFQRRRGAGQVQFEVAPDSSYSFLLENATEGELRIEGSLGGASAGFQLSALIEELDGTLGRHLKAEGWTALDGGEPLSETGVAVTWQGASASGMRSAEIDAKLRAQLEALGYVN